MKKVYFLLCLILCLSSNSFALDFLNKFTLSQSFMEYNSTSISDRFLFPYFEDDGFLSVLQLSAEGSFAWGYQLEEPALYSGGLSLGFNFFNKEGKSTIPGTGNLYVNKKKKSIHSFNLGVQTNNDYPILFSPGFRFFRISDKTEASARYSKTGHPVSIISGTRWFTLEINALFNTKFNNYGGETILEFGRGSQNMGNLIIYTKASYIYDSQLQKELNDNPAINAVDYKDDYNKLYLAAGLSFYFMSIEFWEF